MSNNGRTNFEKYKEIIEFHFVHGSLCTVLENERLKTHGFECPHIDGDYDCEQCRRNLVQWLKEEC